MQKTLDNEKHKGKEPVEAMRDVIATLAQEGVAIDNVRASEVTAKSILDSFATAHVIVDSGNGEEEPGCAFDTTIGEMILILSANMKPGDIAFEAKNGDIYTLALA